jgi:hypothetical protein
MQVKLRFEGFKGCIIQLDFGLMHVSPQNA